MRQRSSLGGHWAGDGMAGPTERQFDNHRINRSIRVPRKGILPTDRFDNTKEGRRKFDEYCKEMSGEVITYNINDRKKEENKP